MLYAFGPYTLNTRARELLGANGVVPLRPKVFGLLDYLIENRDRVVSKQELFEQLWPDVHVGDAALNTCIKAARQAVGDTGRSQAVIQTKHGHGYRFVAAVEERPGSQGEDDGASQPASGGARDDPPLLDSSPQSPTPPAVSADAFPSGKEHRQVTVLHCVLADAAGLAVALGAEAMDETMERFMATADKTVQRYGGTVIQWLGDGFIALFGAPLASEDHARSAVSASLHLLERLDEVGDGLSAGIGLHTGPVVVGTMERDPGQVYTAAGRTTETAKTLQTNAPPSSILASAETFSTVQAEVDAEPFSPRGDAPDALISAYLIRKLLSRHAGVPRRSTRLLTKFVGREEELDILRDRLESVIEGSGRIVGISGEPGIGKSRLVEEFARGLSGNDVRLFRVNCLSYTGTSPYLPARRLLRQICDTRSTDPPELVLTKLKTCMNEAGLSSPVAQALICQLLDLPADLPELERLSPEERRAQTFDHMYSIIAGVCAAQPCVIVIEDVHWIDATSDTWLTGLVMRLAAVQALILATYRPVYRPSWLQNTTATQLALHSLKSHNSTALARSIPTAERLSDEEIGRIVSKAQGNPFFLEELIWTFGADNYERIEIPETVQTVLAARIDQLASADKRLLQIASVIGTEVPVALLRAIDDLGEEEREDSLARLQQAEFVYERQIAPERMVSFKHALTQDVAYMSLIARTREAVHRRIADALESDFQQLASGRPELLAHHLTASGEAQRAVGYWLKAGRHAVERSASAEAIAHLNKGLELLKTLPESAERREQEIAFQLTLGVPLLSTKGHGSPEAERAYRRASELSRARGDALSLFFATWGLWRFSSAKADMRTGLRLAEELLDLATKNADPALLLQAHHAHWTTLYNCGEFGRANEHIDQGLALYDPDQHRDQAFLVAGHDPSVCAHLTAARITWVRGRPDQAMERSLLARNQADELGHPLTVAIALNHALRVCARNRDAEAAQQWLAPLRALAKEHGLAGQASWCDLMQTWVKARLTATGDDITGLRKQLAANPELAGVEVPFAKAILADACRSAARIEDGLEILSEALDEASATGVRFWDAELHRLRGDLLLSLANGDQAEAEACYQESLSIARRQNAKSLELRSAVNLARLWDKQGRRDEARDLVTPVYASFTEGHDTSDLVEARTLLDALSR